MKKILAIIISAAVLLPSFAFAAFNDVSLTTSAVLSVGSYTLDITGSTAAVQSITVNPSNFSVTLAPGSTLQVTSPTFNQMTTDVGTFTTSNVCTTGSSVLTLSGGTGTVTVTPTATICSTSTPAPVVSSGGSSGGHSSGQSSGSGSSGTITTTPATTSTSTSAIQLLQNQIAALMAQIQAFKNGGSVTTTTVTSTVTPFSFTRDLLLGSKGEDVRALQKFLNAHGFTVASTGAGSPGLETTLFGSLTVKAVKKYQASVGISATGYFGPLTRKAVTGQ